MLILLIICQLIKSPTWNIPEKVSQENIERLDQALNLGRNELYDECLEELNKLSLNDCYDPAAFLFYKIICQHQLLKKEECLVNIDLLLERDGDIPQRFSRISKMIRDDISRLEEGSLDEVSKLMNDVERRLSLGRSGQTVKDQQKLVIDKLDKLIEETEKAQQEQQQKSKSGEGKSEKPGSSPLDKSEIKGDNGPGDVDKKKLREDTWGNIPPKERQESIQRLTENLPSHYRDIIEGYFRKLAK